MGRKSDQAVSWGQRAIKAIPNPEPGKRPYYHHPELHKLAVQVTDKGTKTFYYLTRIDGRVERIRIGQFPGLTPSAAVDEAKEIAKQIAKGENPNQQRREHRASPTLRAYWTETFLPKHVEKRLKPRSQEQYGATWKNHIAPALGDRKLGRVSRAEVKRMHAAIGAGGKERAANLALAVLRSMLNHALDAELVKVNPCDRIKLFPETKRERYLATGEIVRLYEALDAHVRETMDWTLHDVVKLALLTGQRRANILAARWQDIDLPAKVWRIPGTETKSNRLYAVRLAPGATEILERRIQEASKGQQRVFADPPSMTIWSFIRPRWDAVRDAAELEGFRFHDLRHSHASLMANAGVPLTVIGRQMGHASISTTQRYAHLVDETVATAVDNAMANLGEGPSGKVKTGNS